MDKLLFLGAFLVVINYVSSLECFTCFEQDGNKDKCTKTTKQCLEYQDTCITYIRWGIPPYWTPRGERIYFISKDCETLNACTDTKHKLRTKCKRDWYRDWSCAECCTGDLCNFYATMGAGTIKASMMTVALTLCAFILRRII